ncbi:hypothetical protein T492DRAFT_981474 [Pavlovales sp. CCMP2436]|nr:hypothetical protein T492DRAFT_981474 [Pavlovales sp. CCMP2436]
MAARLTRFFLLAALALGVCLADEVEVDCGAMKTKELKSFLARKGRKCEGCAERSDFVSLCAEVKDLPDVPPEKIVKPRREGKDKDQSIEDLLASLKGMPGMDNIKVFKPSDLDDMMKNGDLDRDGDKEEL